MTRVRTHAPLVSSSDTIPGSNESLLNAMCTWPAGSTAIEGESARSLVNRVTVHSPPVSVAYRMPGSAPDRTKTMCR